MQLLLHALAVTVIMMYLSDYAGSLKLITLVCFCFGVFENATLRCLRKWTFVQL